MYVTTKITRHSVYKMTENRLRYTVFVYRGQDGTISAYYGKREQCERFMKDFDWIEFQTIGNFKRLSTAQSVAEQHHTGPLGPKQPYTNKD